MAKTVNDLFNLYTKDLTRRNAKTIKQITKLYEFNLQGPLGDKLITEIVRGEIAETHFNISDRSKATANKCLGILKAMFNLAITLSFIENNPATHIPKNRDSDNYIKLLEISKQPGYKEQDLFDEQMTCFCHD